MGNSKNCVLEYFFVGQRMKSGFVWDKGGVDEPPMSPLYSSSFSHTRTLSVPFSPLAQSSSFNFPSVCSSCDYFD
jgi:hypothetical protein